MKNIDVINAFVSGATSGKTKNLRIEGNFLMNYNTCIAEREVVGNRSEYILNMTKYSVSTSTIQNQVKRELYNAIDVMEITDVPMGSQCLSKKNRGLY
jgi:hypothetical protein